MGATSFVPEKYIAMFMRFMKGVNKKSVRKRTLFRLMIAALYRADAFLCAFLSVFILDLH